MVIVDDWVNRMWHILYTLIKTETHSDDATAWVKLEDTVLSEISQSQKSIYCIIPLV